MQVRLATLRQSGVKFTEDAVCLKLCNRLIFDRVISKTKWCVFWGKQFSIACSVHVVLCLTNTDGTEPQNLQLRQRTVIVQRDEKGYGFSVTGDNPVFIQIVKESRPLFFTYICTR